MDEIPSQLGESTDKSIHWQIGHTLGKGSAARVRLATHGATGKTAAIKIIPKSPVGKQGRQLPEAPDQIVTGLIGSSHVQDQRERSIQREIAILKLLRHPNVMRLESVSENAKEVHLVCEYVEGGELFDYISTHGALPEKEAVSIFREIILGVRYGHCFHICHRDLKLENILLDSDHNVKIADYGMAAYQSEGHWLTKHCGSPYYAAPELASFQRYHGDKVDIWSCGVILFALLTGYLPFDGGGLRNTLSLIVKGDFTIPAEMSEESACLVRQMLQKSPENRISISDILLHPLLTKYEHPSNLTAEPHCETVPFLSMEDHGKAIASFPEIDTEIFKDVQILCDFGEDTLTERLLCTEPNLEKMFYNTLLKFRSEKTGIYHQYIAQLDSTSPPRRNTLGQENGQQISRLSISSIGSV